jgi:molybdopterin synthase sulfur carrier subunit
MKVRLRFFASIRETLGTDVEVLETQAATIAALRQELRARNAVWADALAPGRAVRVALNQTMQAEGAALQDDCEVAFFPPVTGG